MIVLPEQMFQDIPEGYHPLGIGKTQNKKDAIVYSAGWYNQIGKFLDAGDLYADDFVSIYTKISAYGLGPFIVVPEAVKHLWAPVLDIHTLAQICAFVIHPEFVHVIDPRFRLGEWGFIEGENLQTKIPYFISSRREIYNLLTNLSPH